MREGQTKRLGRLRHGDLGRLADQLALLVHRRIVAEEASVEVACHGRRQLMSARVLSDFDDAVRHGEELDDTHVTRRQSTGLVGADDGHAAQRLDARKPLDDGFSMGHFESAKSECDGDDDRQALWDRSNGQRHSNRKHFNPRLLLHKTHQQQEGNQAETKHTEPLSQARHADLERRLLLIHTVDHAENIPEFSANTRAIDDASR